MVLLKNFKPTILKKTSNSRKQRNIIWFNPFIPNAPFLYPPENMRKPYGFRMFPGGRERVHWEQMDNLPFTLKPTSCSISIPSK